MVVEQMGLPENAIQVGVVVEKGHVELVPAVKADSIKISQTL